MWGKPIRIDEYNGPSGRMEDGMIRVRQDKFVPPFVFYGIYDFQRKP
jgi:hypothetical protein